MITREILMMGRDAEYPTTEELEKNAAVLLFRVNKFLQAIGAPPSTGITSGYRPGKYNEKYAKTSAHLTCQAVDVADADGSLKKKVTPELLEKYELWAEEFAKTPTWLHLQIRPASQRIYLV